jgi:hypothetical protein
VSPIRIADSFLGDRANERLGVLSLSNDAMEPKTAEKAFCNNINKVGDIPLCTLLAR